MKGYDKIKNMPLTAKLLIGGTPLLIFVVWFVSSQINANKEKRENFTNKISSVVVKSNSYYGRSEEFHLRNGVKLYFMPPISDKIMIGDSIEKESNTYIYDVYRKNVNGNYEFWASYDLNRIY